MERFYNDDNNKEEPFFDPDDDEDEGEEGGDAVAFLDQQSIIDAMQMDLAQVELNQHLVSKAIDIAKDSWFWRFKSSESKMVEIERIYQRLLKLTDSQDDEVEFDDNDDKSEE